MGDADLCVDQVPSVNMVEWRSKCADILMQKARTFIFFIVPDPSPLRDCLYLGCADEMQKWFSCSGTQFR